VLLTAIDVCETVLGESYAKMIGKIPLSDNSVEDECRIFQKPCVIN